MSKLNPPEDDSPRRAGNESRQLDPGEAQRLAARRRFLSRAAAGGSGLVIVTLCHQRAHAGRPGLLERSQTTTTETETVQATNGRPLLVSSEAMCLSLGGQPGNTLPNQHDSITGAQVTRVQCTR